MPPQHLTSPAHSPVSGLASVLSVLKRWRWMLLAAALAAGLAGYATASRGEREYESDVVLLVGSLSSNSDTLQAAGQLAQTYAELATTRPVLAAAAARANEPATAARVTADASTVTRLLTVRVRHTDPLAAARVADGEAAELVAVAERRRGLRPGAGRLRVVEPADVAASPTGPRPMAIAALAALVGLAGALALALLLDRTGDRVKSADDLEAVTGVPCVGSLSGAALRRRRSAVPVVLDEPRSRAAHEYRLLAAKLGASGRTSLLIMAVDGDSAIAAHNLAAAVASSGARVALIDTTTRDPASGEASPAEPSDAPGADRNGHVPAGAALPARVNGNGRRHAARIEVLDANELAELPLGPEGARLAVEQAQEDADMVLLYASSLKHSPDCVAWARAAEGTVLLAERDRTVARDVRATAETLRLVNARLLATVLADPPGILRR